jgi:putative transposase
MSTDEDPDRWARLRVAIIGPLLAAPPQPGALRHALQAREAQYREHPGWMVQLRYDNLVPRAEQEKALRPVRASSTIRRYLRRQGYHRKCRPKPATAWARQAQARLAVRSYEAEYVHGLWRSDFHHGSRRVLAIPETVYYSAAMLFSN